ncbi:hypothetical protein [Neorhizobium sp. NCHU2750]|uniref:hypothetical protein n=1 Tax=Neorhizobium sp. NCHU2750 TaxID=1825976 RepID=UPI000E761868|nr:hypothetical protein NCHU2750_11860 [Neorhizobium sp. NCHU2750]
MQRYRFNIVLPCILAVSLSIKLSLGGTIVDPSFAEVVVAAETRVVNHAVQSAGVTTFAGRTALLLATADCMMYLVPVGLEGWHQQTLRKSMSEGQTLWFFFNGALYYNVQPRWLPMITVYTAKSLRYIGFSTVYHPMYAIVASPECDVARINWSFLPALHFKTAIWEN